MQDAPNPIRLLITDDYALMRDGLKRLFTLVGDIEVVGEAEHGEALLRRLDHDDIDLLLLDMNMPGLCGEALIVRIRALRPALPILVLSTYDEIQIVEAALRAGANGYITKDCDPETLIIAVRQVVAGRVFIDPHLAELMALRTVRSGPGSTPSPGA